MKFELGIYEYNATLHYSAVCLMTGPWSLLRQVWSSASSFNFKY